MTSFLSFCKVRKSFQKHNSITEQYSRNTHSTALTFIIYDSSLQHPLWSTHTHIHTMDIPKKTSIFYLFNQREVEAAVIISIKHDSDHHISSKTKLNLLSVLAD